MNPSALRWLIRFVLVGIMLSLLIYGRLVPAESRSPAANYVVWGLVGVGGLAMLYLVYHAFKR